jgi:hypothetical protein
MFVPTSSVADCAAETVLSAPAKNGFHMLKARAGAKSMFWL